MKTKKLSAVLAGGLGYIGSALIDLLRNDERFEKVIIVDEQFRPYLLSGLPEKFCFVQMDIGDDEKARELLHDVDVVFLLAALVEAEKSAGREALVWETNYDKCRIFAQECPAHTRVVFASTGNVYGGISPDDDWQNITEIVEPRPRLPYAMSKVALENYLSESRDNYTVCRFGTNYGFSPGIRFNIVTNIFVHQALLGKDLVLHGGGLNHRPNVHVIDAARAMMFVATLQEAKGEIYHIVRQNMTIRELAETVASFAPEINLLIEQRENPFNSYGLSSEKLLSNGFEFQWDLESGVADMFDRLKSVRKMGSIN